MVLVQLGSGVPWSWVTLIGCLTGALAHGLLADHLTAKRPSTDDNLVAKAIFDVVRIPDFVVRLIFIVVLALAVFLMEFFIPWASEYKKVDLNNFANIFVLKAWPPFGKTSSFNNHSH